MTKPQLSLRQLVAVTHLYPSLIQIHNLSQSQGKRRPLQMPTNKELHPQWALNQIGHTRESLAPGGPGALARTESQLPLLSSKAPGLLGCRLATQEMQMSVHLSKTHRGKAVNHHHKHPRVPIADLEVKFGLGADSGFHALAGWETRIT